ncbi:hypothetical protein A9Q81_11495 [Gammaproteobacteria bacterium 42_54_T18]|nr:hypothetical protein A9Q81_11495 [Gammaproteobacteria bacterium 42_54_T18]
MDFSINFVEIWAWQITVLDFVISVALVVGLRKLTGLVANLSTTEELAERDNFAFGISLAGAIFALSLMLTGVLSGDVSTSLLNEAILLIGYGVFGVLLIKIGRFILDRWVLRGVEIQKEIKNANVSVALVDVANVVATGIILRAVLGWIEGDLVLSVIALVMAFVVTQLLLSLVSYSRVVIFSKRNKGRDWQKEISSGNSALALRYMGHIIGASLAVTAASGLVIYNEQNIFYSLVMWAVAAIDLVVVVTLFSFIARKFILNGVDVVEEVDAQGNIGVATIEAVIFVSIGLLLITLLT